MPRTKIPAMIPREQIEGLTYVALEDPRRGSAIHIVPYNFPELWSSYFPLTTLLIYLHFHSFKKLYRIKTHVKFGVIWTLSLLTLSPGARRPDLSPMASQKSMHTSQKSMHCLRVVDQIGTGLGKGGGERLSRREKRKEMLGEATGWGNPQVEVRTVVTVVRMRERILGGIKKH